MIWFIQKWTWIFKMKRLILFPSNTFLRTFFDVDHFFKSSLNLLQYSFCFMFWFSGCEACGILALWPGIKPAPPALEGKILTTGLPGKSLCVHFHFWDKVGEPQLVCSVSYSPWKYFLLWEKWGNIYKVLRTMPDIYKPYKTENHI